MFEATSNRMVGLLLTTCPRVFPADMELLVEILDKIKSFNLVFDSQKIQRETALSFATELKKLSDRIFETYNVSSFILDGLPPEPRRSKVDGMGGELGNKLHREDTILAQTSGETEEHDTTIARHDSTRGILDPTQISQEHIRSLLDQVDRHSVNVDDFQRQKEANEVAIMAVKFTSSTCGIFYKDTPKEKSFCDDFKKRITQHFPSVKSHKDFFYFMAFSLLDRIVCSVCSKCTSSPALTIKSFRKSESGKQPVLRQNTSMTGNYPLQTPPQSFEGTDSPNNTPDVHSVVNIVYGLDYYKLGFCLCLSPNTLKAIKKNEDDNFQRLTEVIDSWLKRKDSAVPATWKCLADAVDSNTRINEPQIAKEIRTKYVYDD